METPFKAPAFEELVAEQTIVQAAKFQGRMLRDYSESMFPHQTGREVRASAVTDFVRPLCGDERVSLGGVIRGMCNADATDVVHWADMGGGRGLAMREMAVWEQGLGCLALTNVDLIDYGLEGLELDDLNYAEKVTPGITAVAMAPQLVRANVETVVLPEPATLITSVEAMQYLNDPLRAISNWYDQLADDGLLIVSTGHDWSRWVRYERGSGDADDSPSKQLLEALAKAAIPHAASYEPDWESGHRPLLDPAAYKNLVIQKVPGVRLAVQAPVASIWTNMYDYKAAYYERPDPAGPPLIEVVADDHPSR